MTEPQPATLSLLARRRPDATIWSERGGARDRADWRGAMPAARAAIDGLVLEGLVRLS